MTPKNIKLGPGTVYFHTPDGLHPLAPLSEAQVVEAEETEWADETKWPKANPYIKTAQEATFTAELKISPDIAKAFTALSEACGQTAEALVKFVRAAVDYVAAVARGADTAQLLKAAKVQAALGEAPPRVRHLAQHGKKIRTQKKNINRALRDYERRRSKSGRT